MYRSDRLQTTVIQMCQLFIGLEVHLYQIYQHYMVKVIDRSDHLQTAFI